MSELAIQFVRILLISSILAFSGELFDRWLATNGYVRRLAGWPTIIAFGTIIIKEFLFPNASWWTYSIRF